MLVNASQLKQLRQSRNWTQQQLADACGLSMRTIQRVEKDGVASNDTVAAYAAVFELQASELLITVDEFESTHRRGDKQGIPAWLAGGLFFGGFGLGMALAVWLF